MAQETFQWELCEAKVNAHEELEIETLKVELECIQGQLSLAEKEEYTTHRAREVAQQKLDIGTATFKADFLNSHEHVKVCGSKALGYFLSDSI